MYANSRYDEPAFMYIPAMETQLISNGFDETWFSEIL
jgi:hypothetical protein